MKISHLKITEVKYGKNKMKFYYVLLAASFVIICTWFMFYFEMKQQNYLNFKK